MYRVTGLSSSSSVSLAPSEHLTQVLNARAPLDPSDVAALATLPYNIRTVQRGDEIAEEGQVRTSISLILSGYAMRYRQTRNGGRQIISIDTTGGIIDASYLFFNRCDQTVQALTPLAVAEIPVADLRRVLDACPNLLNALVVDHLVHASITQQWLANIGGRSAFSRTAHLLCEFAVRVGRAGDDGCVDYELPLTQTELAELLGLTLVHMNRTLKLLVAKGLIERKRERLRIIDIAKLEAAADFSARYLHLDRSSRDRRAVKRVA